MSFLSIQNLFIDYQTNQGSRAEAAVRDVSFEVDEGEVVALVGESGSGKSTVALAMGRLLARGVRVEGSIVVGGQDVLGMSDKNLREYRRHTIAYVFQEPAVSLNPVLRIRDQIEEIWPRRDASRVVKLLEDVQLKDPVRVSRAYPHELSGGMQQRVMLAMALAKSPKLLIADEPTTALDATVQQEILKLLLKLKREQSLTLLFITHDIHVARVIANRLLIMKSGQLVENLLNTKDVKVKHDYTRLLLSNALLNQTPKTRLGPKHE